MAPVINVFSHPKEKWYIAGDQIDFSVKFSTSVVVIGTPAISFLIGAVGKSAAYVSGNKTNTLLFSYTVLEGDSSETSHEYSESQGGISGVQFDLPSGSSIKAADGTQADLSLNGTATSFAKVKVDAVPPTAITAVCDQTSGTIKLGQYIDLHISFSKPVYVDSGSLPFLDAVVGQKTRPARYFAGHGTDSLTFRYATQAGDFSESGVELRSPIKPPRSLSDWAGNLFDGAFSTVSSNVMVDAIKPASPFVSLTDDTGQSATDRVTNNAALKISNLEDGAVAQFSLNEGANWGETISPAQGLNTVWCKQTDKAGNPSSITKFSFRFDTERPDAPIPSLKSDTGISATDQKTSNPTLQFIETPIESGAFVEYKIAASEWSRTLPVALMNDGQISVSVRQTDLAGNVSKSSTINFTLDRSQPSPPKLSLKNDTGEKKNDLVTSDASTTVSQQESNALVEYSKDNGLTWSDSFHAAEGLNVLLVRQTDVAGNRSSSRFFSFTLDTQSPDAPVAIMPKQDGSLDPKDILRQTQVAAGWIDTNSSIQFSNDGTQWSKSASLQTGNNQTLHVRQIDLAGNASASITINYNYHAS